MPLLAEGTPLPLSLPKFKPLQKVPAVRPELQHCRLKREWQSQGARAVPVRLRELRPRPSMRGAINVLPRRVPLSLCLQRRDSSVRVRRKLSLKGRDSSVRLRRKLSLKVRDPWEPVLSVTDPSGPVRLALFRKASNLEAPVH